MGLPGFITGMEKKMIRLFVIVIGAIGFVASAASAAVSYSFVAGQSSYEVLPGQEVMVPIYLKETLTDGSSSQIAAQNGLFSFGITVTRTSGDGQIRDLVRHTAFDRRNLGSTNAFPANPAKLWAEQDVNFGNGVSPDAAGLIHLATLRFEAPITGDATLSIGDYNAGTGETVTYSFSELDSLIAPGSFTVTTAIPEPAGLSVLAIAAAGLLRRRRAC